MTASETVLATLEDGVLKLTLNRPDKLNSFNEEMHRALRVQLERAHADEAIRAVLTEYCDWCKVLPEGKHGVLQRLRAAAEHAAAARKLLDVEN